MILGVLALQTSPNGSNAQEKQNNESQPTAHTDLIVPTLSETWASRLTRIVPGSHGQYTGTERWYPIFQATIDNNQMDDGAEAVMRSE